MADTDIYACHLVLVLPEEFKSTLHEQLGDLEGVEVLRDDMLVVGYCDTEDKANKNHDENILRLLKRAREIN